jgi:hypothetical protein
MISADAGDIRFADDISLSRYDIRLRRINERIPAVIPSGILTVIRLCEKRRAVYHAARSAVYHAPKEYIMAPRSVAISFESGGRRLSSLTLEFSIRLNYNGTDNY